MIPSPSPTVVISEPHGLTATSCIGYQHAEEVTLLPASLKWERLLPPGLGIRREYMDLMHAGQNGGAEHTECFSSAFLGDLLTYGVGCPVGIAPAIYAFAGNANKVGGGQTGRSIMANWELRLAVPPGHPAYGAGAVYVL